MTRRADRLLALLELLRSRPISTAANLAMRLEVSSALVMAKADIPTIQKISGHKTPSQVLHYVHFFGDHVHDAPSALNIAVPESITKELHAPLR